MPKTNKKELLTDLKNLIVSSQDIIDIILVEGNKDVKAIRSLGYKGKIEVCVHQKTTLSDISTKIGGDGRKILILTDFDPKGIELNSRFTSLLQGSGSFVNIELRGLFGKKLISIGTRAIEGINNLIELIG
jgi:5S rRNA maturation endonuclease (ribonuclease M5)